jgi:hypothetical protein
MRLLSLVIALLLSAAASAQPNALSDQEQKDGWALLFDGKSLDGWTTSGEIAAWTVEQDKNGPVLTMAQPGKGAWLRTTRMYRDFELLVDFDVAKGKNSGVGLRGSSCGDPAFTGMEIQVFGNQGEKPTITSCGSVYDAIAPTAMPLKDGGQWNTFRIKLVGDTLNIWLNGQQIHKDQKLDSRGYTHKPEAKNPLNSRCPTGFIALQDHGDKVRFRNIKIKDLSTDKDPGGFVPIFNGKDTSGWNTKAIPGDGNGKIEDGVLIVRNTGLLSEAQWKDYEVRAFVKVSQAPDPGRGAIGVRALTEQTPSGEARRREITAVIDNHDPKRFTGAILTGQAATDAVPLLHKPITSDGDWFDMHVRVTGHSVRTWINGHATAQTLTDLTDGGVSLVSGAGEIMFKDVQVRDLTK